MPFKKGEPRPENAGRKAGARNRATATRERRIAESGVTPLDYMIGVMRNVSADPEMRLDAAAKAAPYVHPKLASVQVTGKDGEPFIPETDRSKLALVLLNIIRGEKPQN